MKTTIYIYELEGPEGLVRKNADADRRIEKIQDINILTIKRGNDVLIPAADTMIKPDDIAFVLGEAGAIQKALGKR